MSSTLTTDEARTADLYKRLARLEDRSKKAERIVLKAQFAMTDAINIVDPEQVAEDKKQELKDLVANTATVASGLAQITTGIGGLVISRGTHAGSYQRTLAGFTVISANLDFIVKMAKQVIKTLKSFIERVKKSAKEAVKWLIRQLGQIFGKTAQVAPAV